MVVNGLAVGCDAAAHNGCLKNHGKTVAVLAHGLDQVHPPVNHALADKIIKSGGCLVSEYPISTRPHPSLFVERDRLESGPATGVVVVETPAGGGTMHTVRHAIRQKRDIACLVPPSELWKDPRYSGNRKLIENHSASPLDSDKSITHFAASIRSVLLTTPATPGARPKPQGRKRQIKGVVLDPSQTPISSWTS